MNRKKTNLLFIIPSSFYIENYQRKLNFDEIPIEILQYSSLLQNLLVNTKIIDLRLEELKYPGLIVNDPNFQCFERSLLKVLDREIVHEYQNIAIICKWTNSFLQTEIIAKILHKTYPEINIIVGGDHSEQLPSDFLYKSSPFDYVISNNTESTLLDLFKSEILMKNKPSKTVKIGSDMCLDINSLPFPDYELYLTQYPDSNIAKFPIFMSKGCPFHCAFCPTVHQITNLNFSKFIENFESLMMLLEKFNKSSPKIMFLDRVFNSASISRDVLNYIIKNNLSERFRFSCQTRLETISKYPELIDLFRKSNMIVGFGFESANKELLIEMNKSKNPGRYIEKMSKILEIYRNLDGIYCRINILVGFPGETRASFNDTIEFINQNALHENIQIGPTLYSNFPNTFVYKNMLYYEEKYGADFIKEWWKIHANPLKNSIPVKASKNYHKKEIIGDYLTHYGKILKQFPRAPHYSFADITTWALFFKNWYNELQKTEK